MPLVPIWMRSGAKSEFQNGYSELRNFGSGAGMTAAIVILGILIVIIIGFEFFSRALDKWTPR